MTGKSVESLSDKQLQCLELVGEGYTSAEIEGLLGISSSTINSHVSLAVQILGASIATRASAGGTPASQGSGASEVRGAFLSAIGGFFHTATILAGIWCATDTAQLGPNRLSQWLGRAAGEPVRGRAGGPRRRDRLDVGQRLRFTQRACGRTAGGPPPGVPERS